MSGNKYTVPLGVNAEGLINPLNETIATMEKVESTAKDASKEIQEAFNKGGKSADDLEQKMKPISKGLEAVKTLGKEAGKELADAFSSKNIDPSKLEKAVAGFRDKLSGMSASIDIDINPAKLAILEKQLQGAKNEVEELEVALGFAREVLNSLDPNTAEFMQLAEAVEFVDAALSEFSQHVQAVEQSEEELAKQNVNLNATFEEVYGDLQPLTTRLGELEDRMYELALAGKDNTEEFKALQAEARRYRAIIQEVDASVDNFTKTSAKIEALVQGASGLVGAFTAVQGVVALTVGENEELEKVLIKVNGAMAVLQGLQAAAEVLNKDSAFSTVFLSNARRSDTAAIVANTTAQGANTVAMGAATVATNLFSLALKAIGIGLVIAALAYLVEYWDDLTASVKKFLPAGANVSKWFDTAKASVLAVGSAVTDYLIAPIKALISVIQGDFRGALDDLVRGFKVVENVSKGYADAQKKIATNHALEAKAARMEIWKKNIEIQEAEGKDVYKTQVKWYENNIALLKKQGKDTKDAEHELNLYKARKRGEDAKNAEAAAQRAAEARKKAADKAKAEAAKAAEEAKKQAELVLKYTNEINSLRVSSIEDSYQQERAAIKADAENKIRELSKDDARTVAAKQKQAELILAINADANKRLAELEKKHNDEIAAVRLEGAKMLADLSVDSKDKALDLLALETQEKLDKINEIYAKEPELREKLLNAVVANDAKKRKEIALKYGQDELNVQEQKAIALMELTRNKNTESVAQAEQHELALLEVKRQAAEKALALLLANGKNENDIEVLNAKLKVKEIQDAIEKQAKNGKKFDLFKYMGIGSGWNKEQTDAMKQAASDLLNNVSQITDALVEQYQRQIDKKQESIDQYNSEIDDLESQLETEKDLRDQGLANNVETLEKEIEAKKAQRDEEIRQQKEMQQKQAEIQKAQMAVDTAVQLVNMITSATNIFNSLSGIPFVGVPMAIALISTMFGAFALTKAKAYQAINSGQKFRKGGWIDGYSHEQGGKKYYSPDGDVKELEKDEFVMSREPAKKYAALLEAMNTGNFDNLSFADLQDMGLLGALGLSLYSDAIPESVEQGKALDNLRTNINIQTGNDAPDFSRIERDLAYLAESKRQQGETWEDADYYYRRKGTVITRIKK